MPGTHSRILLLSAVVLGRLVAGPPLTTIQDTIYKADGTRFTGVLEIAWKTFRAADGSQIAQNAMSVRVTNGQLSVALVPTTTAITPFSYTVRYSVEGRTQQFVENWTVPVSAGPLRLKDVRTPTAVTPPPPLTDPQVVSIQDVAGLRTELDQRLTRGPSFQAGRVAVVSLSGSIDGAIGSPGDCMRVDGTAGPCGNGGLMFVDAETPLGATNGANRDFVLSAVPSPVASLALYRNGMLLKQGAAYTVSGKTITFSGLETPQANDMLTAWYRVDANATAMIGVSDLETPSGVLDGVNRVFTLSGTPAPAASLQLYRNGLLQKLGIDFTLAVNTITFTTVSTPKSGDILLAMYRK
jgi:hypothetical protein